MSARVHPYIGAGGCRQMRPFGGLAAAALALSLGGCASLGLPVDTASETGSIAAAESHVQPILASAVVVDQADPSDWDMIRRTIAGAPKAAGRLEWNNAVTGSVGSIAVAATGQDCRAFAVTINDVRGVRRYRGAACPAAGGHSQLRDVVADDATLL